MKKFYDLTLAATLAFMSASTVAIASPDPFGRSGLANSDIQAIMTDPTLAALMQANGSVKNMPALAALAFAFGVTSLTANPNGTFNAIYGSHTYTIAVDPSVQQGVDMRAALLVDSGNLIIQYGDGTSQKIIILNVQ